MKKMYEKYEDFKEDLEKGAVKFESYDLITFYNKISKMSDLEQLLSLKDYLLKEKEVLTEEAKIFSETKLEGNFVAERLDIGKKYYERIFEIFENRLKKINELLVLLKNDNKITLNTSNKYLVKDWEEVYDADTGYVFHDKCQSKRLNIVYDSLFKNIYNAFLVGMYDLVYEGREFDNIYVLFKTSGGKYKNYEFCTDIKNLTQVS